MAIDRPSLLKEAAPLRLVAGCGTQTASAGLVFNSRDIYVSLLPTCRNVVFYRYMMVYATPPRPEGRRLLIRKAV